MEMKPRKAFEWAKLKQPFMHNKDIVNYFNVPEQKGGVLKYTPEMNELEHGDNVACP